MGRARPMLLGLLGLLLSLLRPGAIGGQQASSAGHRLPRSRRRLAAAADLADEADPSRWPRAHPFYKPGYLVDKAIGALMAKDQSEHWVQWEQATVNVHNAAHLGIWERNTTGATCQSASHCEDLCRERCLMDRIKQHCAREKCASSCTAIPNSCDDHRRHCEYECGEGCLGRCVQRGLVDFRRELQSCYPARLGKCLGRCRADRKKGHGKEFLRCAKICIDDAQMTCVGAHTRPCEEQCGRHSCLEGRCACPAMLSGDDECTAKPDALWKDAPELTRNCFQSIFDPKFKGINSTVITDTSFTSPTFRTKQDTWSIYQAAASAVGKRKTLTRPDLPHFADWTSCALIGSSGSLTGSGMGKIIDESHTAWVRFNDAPTIGFEKDVGSRTTLRIQNNLYCGFNEGKKEMCAPYTKFATKHKCHPTEGRACPLVLFSDAVHSVVHDFMKPEFFNHPSVDLGNDHWNTTGHVDTSAGFFGTLLALNLCSEVAIYGFDQAPTHYYNKKPGVTKKPFEQRHAWGAEHYCAAQYQQRYSTYRVVESRGPQGSRRDVSAEPKEASATAAAAAQLTGLTLLQALHRTAQEHRGGAAHPHPQRPHQGLPLR